MPENDSDWGPAPDGYKPLRQDVVETVERLAAERGLPEWSGVGRLSGRPRYSRDDAAEAKAWNAVFEEATDSYLADLRDGRRTSVASLDGGYTAGPSVPQSWWLADGSEKWLFTGRVSSLLLDQNFREATANLEGCGLFVPADASIPLCWNPTGNESVTNGQ